MFGFLNRGRPELAADPAPVTPQTIRLRHIDMELEKLAAIRPRTANVWTSIDYFLDRRNAMRAGKAAPQ